LQTRLLERARPGAVLLAGTLATATAIALTIPATGAADAILALIAVILAGGTTFAWRETRRLAELPLELAPIALRGVVDGAILYRFRARLGRGRTFRDAQARVWFEPAEGEAIELVPRPLPPLATGPLTVVVADPDGRIAAPGAFRVALEVRSRGRSWTATATIAAIEEGRFDGIALVAGRVAFGEDWDRIRPPLAG
jgi:hypothetical protein